MLIPEKNLTRSILQKPDDKKCNDPLTEVKVCANDRCNSKVSKIKKEQQEKGKFENLVCGDIPNVKYSTIIENPVPPLNEGKSVKYKCNVSGKIIDSKCHNGMWELPLDLCENPDTGPMHIPEENPACPGKWVCNNKEKEFKWNMDYSKVKMDTDGNYILDVNT